jgi:hypothetical protein
MNTQNTYIQIVNGLPEGFLITEENLMALAYTPSQLVGHPTFYKINLVDRPYYPPEDYMWVDDTPTYTVTNNEVFQSWQTRPLTDDEKNTQDENIKQGKIDILNHLIQDATNSLSDTRATEPIKETLNSYIQNLNILLTQQTNSENVAIQQILDTKICVTCLFD